MTTDRTPNLAALLADAAHRRPDHPALTWDDGALSWRELEARSAGAARRLARQGVGAGDVVALLLPNTWGLAAALWGGLALGATVAPLNPLLAADEREKILGHLGPKAVIDAAPTDESAEAPPIADATAPGIVLYTSGSTGLPKAVLRSVRADVWDAWHKMLAFHGREGDQWLCITPMNLGVLAGALRPMLLFGGSLVVLRQFSVAATVAAIGPPDRPLHVVQPV